MKIASILFIIFALLCFAKGAKILGIFYMPSYSHFVLGNTLMKELVAHGHEVTVIAPYKQIPPLDKYQDILVEEFIEHLEGVRSTIFSESDKNVIAKIMESQQMCLQFTESLLKHQKVQELLKSTEKFDLVIMEDFLNDALAGFCYHYNAPCMLYSTIGASAWINFKVGNPVLPSYVPDVYLDYAPSMTFFERMINTFVYFGANIYKNVVFTPKHNQLLQTHFPGAPHVSELYYNHSMILINSHISVNQPIPNVPSMINIGGFHVKPPKKLPEDLQKFLDDSTEGVIYFSMGSFLKSKDLPQKDLQALLNVFSKLKERVLWKWETEILPNQPKNVKIQKWLPQQDILAHPNIKLFITHGGLLSNIETIYHGVPVIGLPVYGDQQMNMKQAVNGGYGISIPYNELTEAKLTEALKYILNNPKYRENAQRRSKIMHDQPIKPLDNAVFWIEYVLRHRGARHLKIAAMELTWCQYILLDVVGFLICIIIVFSYSVVLVIRKICSKRKRIIAKASKKTKIN